MFWLKAKHPLIAWAFIVRLADLHNILFHTEVTEYLKKNYCDLITFVSCLLENAVLPLLEVRLID